MLADREALARVHIPSWLLFAVAGSYLLKTESNTKLYGSDFQETQRIDIINGRKSMAAWLVFMANLLPSNKEANGQPFYGIVCELVVPKAAIPQRLL